MSLGSEEPRPEEAHYALKLLFRGRNATSPAFHRLSDELVNALVETDLTQEGDGWRAREVEHFMKRCPLHSFDRKLMEMARALVSL